jgi:hypothetical protein
MKQLTTRPFEKFLRMTKVEEQADGTLMAYGLLTAQELDQDGEVCDYESTKPYFKALVARYEKTTGAVEGMDVSLYPVREMHQLIAAGCGKKIEFDDAAKTIRVGVHVVDQSSAEKVRKGVLVGFSQGGSYVKTWEKNKATWYTADPAEVSLVDSPCLKRAMIDQIAEKSFTFVDKNGSMEMRKFVAPKAAAPPSIKDRALEVFKSKGLNTQQTADAIAKAYRFLSGDKLAKGMWTVQETASIVESLSWITAMSEAERISEGDSSPVPGDLRDVLQSLIDAFIDMVDEETKELIAALEGVAAEKGNTNMELTKAQVEEILAKAKSAAGHCDAMKAMQTDHCDKTVAAAQAHMKKAHGMIDKCKAALPGAEKSGDGEGDDAEKARKAKEAEELAKSMKCEHEKSYKESCDECGRVVKAKVAENTDKTYTKAELDAELDKRFKAFKESASTEEVRGTLVPREGESVIHLEKRTSPVVLETAGSGDSLADDGF